MDFGFGFLTVRDSSKYDGVGVSNPSANATPLSVALLHQRTCRCSFAATTGERDGERS
jgi:hypothetical protein